MQDSDINKNKILIIDDDKILRETVCEILSLKGYISIEATGGKEGIEIYKSEKENIKLIILDLIMSGISGKETFYLLKKIDPNVKIIIYSGLDENKDITEMLQNDFTFFMHKPFKIKELVSIIESN